MARQWGGGRDGTKMVAKYELNQFVKFNSGTGSLAWAFNQLQHTLSKYPGALSQTKGVNEAFYKAGLQYKKGIRAEYKAKKIGKRTGALWNAIQAKRGKAAFRPSAMMFAGGGKGSKHRNLIEGGFTPGFSDKKVKGKPYVVPGLKRANSSAIRALENYIRSNQDQIIKDANRIAISG